MTLRKMVAAFVLVGAAAPFAAGQPPREIEFDLGGGVRVAFARISAGTFTQGSREKESGRGDDEAERDVTISSDFYMGRTEVTVGQFRRFVEETKYRTEAEKGTSAALDGMGRNSRSAPTSTGRTRDFRRPMSIRSRSSRMPTPSRSRTGSRRRWVAR